MQLSEQRLGNLGRASRGNLLPGGSALAAVLLDLCDRGAQPSAVDVFQFVGLGLTVERVQGLAGGIERNVAAGNGLGALAGRDQRHEHTIGAGPGIVLGVVIHARRRVLEDETSLARLARRRAVATFFEKIQLELQNF
jgi:hypothetical protein